MVTDDPRLDEVYKDVPEKHLSDEDIEELYKIMLKNIKRGLENDRQRQNRK